MTADSIQQVIREYGGLVVLGLVTYALSKILRIPLTNFRAANARSAALWSLGAVLAGWLLVSALFLLASAGQTGSTETTLAPQTYSLGSVINQFIAAAVIVLPPIFIMQRRGETRRSVGIGRRNLASSLVIGIILSGIMVLARLVELHYSLGQAAGLFTMNSFWALLLYAVVGFTEEFLFRGYLQTRLVAWLGRWPGWIIASVGMAMAHVVQRMTMAGMSFSAALVDSASLIPISLTLGYIMLRTENIAAVGLVHTFADWIDILG